MNDSGGHYYDPETGNPRFEVKKKTGPGFRKATIKDARENGWMISPTTLLKLLHKPELERWKFNQIIAAARTLPMRDGESDEDYGNRIIEDAFAEVDTAADVGTQIHRAIEFYFQGLNYDPVMDVYLNPVKKWVAENGVTFLAHESRIINHEIGVCGTTDGIISMRLQDGKGVLDMKSRKTKPDKEVKPYQAEPMQIAAYAAPVGAKFGINLYISTTEPGRIETAFYDHSRLKAEYECFKHIVAVYRHLNNFPHVPKVLTNSTF